MMTHCLRPLLLGGVLLLANACASGDYDTWASHPTQYASDRHMGFSTANVGRTQTKVSADDVARAQKEQWWGRGVTGLLAGSDTPPAAVAGLWRGSWAGPGLSSVERGSGMIADLAINPDGYGRGRIALLDATAVEGVPWSLRQAGSAGVQVWVKVDGNRVLLREAEEPASSTQARFSAEFAAQGDRMEGQFRYARYPVRMALVRVP